MGWPGEVEGAVEGWMAGMMRWRTMMVMVEGDGCCRLHGLTVLHVPIDRGDVVAGEHARLAVAASFPPVGVRVVQDLNKVATSEAQLAFLLGVEVEERLHVCGVLINPNIGGGGRETL